LAGTRQGCYKRAYQCGLDDFRFNAKGSQEEGEASVITSKPAIRYHFKTGQRKPTRTRVVIARLLSWRNIFVVEAWAA
jgi:hypothetical protein